MRRMKGGRHKGKRKGRGKAMINTEMANPMGKMGRKGRRGKRR